MGLLKLHFVIGHNAMILEASPSVINKSWMAVTCTAKFVVAIADNSTTPRHNLLRPAFEAVIGSSALEKPDKESSPAETNLTTLL
jgi:hypothetical protein